MKAFFARFGANYDRDYAKEQPDGGPSAFKVAWLLWGGSSARSFANRYANTDEDRFMDNRSERHIQKIEETETQIVITFGKSDQSQEDEVDMELDEAGYGKDKDKDKYRRESRPSSDIEIRETDDGGINVEGYAAVFDSETVIGGKWRESIARGAFTDAVNRDDVVFLVNHTGLPLARTRSGTLELSEDEKGLKIRASLDPSDPDVRSIVPKMKRGDLDKMSFAFVPTRQKWSDAEDMPQRVITEAELHDVSIVTTPAYESTSIGIRSALDSLELHRKRQKRSQAARRLRMKAKTLPQQLKGARNG